MMKILIDNKDLKLDYNIDVLDYTGALSFATERKNERIWFDKSGVDKNLENIRYDEKEFELKCLIKAVNEAEAYNKVKVLVDYMFEKGCFVLSLRDDARGIRECFPCQRSNVLVDSINIREQNSLYVFKLGLKDINPNAVKYKTEIISGEASINYDKGQAAVIYWGNGDRDLVSNSGTYTKSDFASDGFVDVIIDIDDDDEVVDSMSADFVADKLTGITPEEIQFTDQSQGDIVIWSWNFGDGNTSSEQNPTHTYTTAGLFTVTLQVFNAVGGVSTEVKSDYLNIRRSRILINDEGNYLLINDEGNYLLKN